MMGAVPASLPPGPAWPRLIQTAGFILGGARFLEACRRRYGNIVTFRTVFDSSFVMLFDPDQIKQLFQGSPQRLHAGEANALLGPVLGERSVLLLDGDEHLRHRRLMLPAVPRPAHAGIRAGYARRYRRRDRFLASGRAVPLFPSMQSLTLGVIVRAVFGYRPAPAEAELRRRLRTMVTPVAQSSRTSADDAAGPAGEPATATRQFEAARQAVDELLFAEIARRRGDPDLESRDDVFSALLMAADEDGRKLSDEEVSDELVTLLLAGHETTATGLAWTFDLLLHDPAVLDRARQRDDEYLDAVAKESLRVRPVIPGVGRVVRGEPFRLNGYEIPPGIRDQPVDPGRSPPRGSVSGSTGASGPNASSDPRRRIPIRGSPSAAEPAVALAPALR